MKYRNILFLLPTLLLCSFTSEKKEAKTYDYDGKAYDKSQKLDLSDETEEEVKTYYNYDTLVKKTGKELNSYLRDIISNDNYFISYDAVSDWYSITDRNWEISSNVDVDTYKFDDEDPSSYYLMTMYFGMEANYDTTKAINNKVNTYGTDTSLDHIDFTNKKKPDSATQIDKEHVWAKNKGFKVKSNGKDVLDKGAPTDLHHLVAADHTTNSSGHNDYCYGEIKDKSKAKEIYCHYADGTTELSGWLDTSSETFEPTDEWKGDVARSLLYMATRYSEYLDTNTQSEPYLEFSETSESDNTVFHGYHKNLSTFLKWNKKDPVSVYEYHRNNLIYNNVQKNRNPFIDFPELADWIYDTDSIDGTLDYVEPVDDNPTKKKEDFSSLKSEYNIHVEDEIDLGISLGTTMSNLKVEYDNSLIELSSSKTKVTAKNEGKTDLIYTYTDEDGNAQEKKTTINVKSKVTLESLKPDAGVFQNMNLVTGETYEFDIAAKEGTMFDSEKFVLESTDSKILEVTSANTVTAKSQGECELNIKLEGDCSRILKTITVKVSLSEEERKKMMIYRIVIIVAAVLLVGIFLLLAVLIKKSDKKGKNNGKNIVEKVYNSTKKSSSKKTGKKSGPSQKGKRNNG